MVSRGLVSFSSLLQRMTSGVAVGPARYLYASNARPLTFRPVAYVLGERMSSSSTGKLRQIMPTEYEQKYYQRCNLVQLWLLLVRKGGYYTVWRQLPTTALIVQYFSQSICYWKNFQRCVSKAGRFLCLVSKNVFPQLVSQLLLFSFQTHPTGQIGFHVCPGSPFFLTSWFQAVMWREHKTFVSQTCCLVLIG